MFTGIQMAALIMFMNASPTIRQLQYTTFDTTDLLVARRVKKVILSFDNQDLVKVVKKISKLTGKNFILENGLRKEKLTIISSTPVTIDEAYEAFVDALHGENLKVVAVGKFFKISRNHGYLRVERENKKPQLEVVKVNDTTWKVKRKSIEENLKHLSRIAIQARIVPYMENGETRGIKLYSIRPGSLYQLLGIKNGDVIYKINGTPIISPETALRVYEKAKKKVDKIVVELSRRGEDRTFTYLIE